MTKTSGPEADHGRPAGEAPRFGSDIVVDLLRAHGIRHVALNPGASFRGLHDSLVNRPAAPEIITCPHEKLAVNIAHGFAKASGEPMAAILHDTVGLLHGSLGLFLAYIDRAPVLVLGGAGPMDTARRRPWIDWIHTSNIQGNAVRGFTKWDDQPASIAAMPEALARAVSVMRSEPAGPVYVALDADLQEQAVDAAPGGLAPGALPAARPMGADPAALDEVARLLVDARRPVLVAGFAGRDPRAFDWIPALAELTGAGVLDNEERLNLPTTHPANVTGSDVLADADLVLLLDMKDVSRVLLTADPPNREARSTVRPECTIVDLGFNDQQVSSWVHDFGATHRMDLRVTADTSVALPQLVQRVSELVRREDAARAAERAQRRQAVHEIHDAQRARWVEIADRRHDERPISPPRLAREIWAAIREHDWVLTAGTANNWALRLWDVDRAYRHPGRSLGTATQIGISLGVALAHRDTGRLVVDIQPDGDLMFDAGALWVATQSRIPLLVVMFNNRAYYNDWEHQIRIAKARGSDPERAHIGVSIDGPAPDFATLARSFGWHAQGPIEDPDLIAGAVRDAARVVLEEGRPALVDVVTAHR